MKAHDKVRLETMRNIKKVILEAKTRPGAGDQIDDTECIKLIQKLAKQGKESAEIYTQRHPLPKSVCGKNLPLWA